MSFEIEADWEDSEDDVAELRATTARLTIKVASRIVTHAEDAFSKTVTDGVRVAVYPLAAWLVSNWWRLRWEAANEEWGSISPHDWRMAHQLPAIGHGFVWPPAEIQSDGRNIEVMLFDPRPRPNEPLRYLERFTVGCAAEAFEQGVDRFIELVLSRLADSGIATSDLSEDWALVREERSSAEASYFRRVEARLGLDPEASPEVVRKFVSFRSTCGNDALEELASASGLTSPAQFFPQVARLAQVGGIRGRFSSMAPVGEPDARLTPWDEGRSAAARVRRELRLDGNPLTNAVLGELLGLTGADLAAPPRTKNGAAAVAIPQDDESVSFLFQKSISSSRRFEGARLLGDHLLTARRGEWLVATDAKTWRQRAERAFAAELLAPIDALKERLQGDYGDENMEQVARLFEVSPYLVQSQLANHGVIQRERVAGR